MAVISGLADETVNNGVKARLLGSVVVYNHCIQVAVALFRCSYGWTDRSTYLLLLLAHTVQNFNLKSSLSLRDSLLRLTSSAPSYPPTGFCSDCAGGGGGGGWGGVAVRRGSIARAKRGSAAISTSKAPKRLSLRPTVQGCGEMLFHVMFSISLSSKLSDRQDEWIGMKHKVFRDCIAYR